jgi:formylmethanofuran dehydrogenase subunit E
MTLYREETDIMAEEASTVGEPEDASFRELAGIAPPCDECGKQEASEVLNGRDLCPSCADEVSTDSQTSDSS